VPPLRPRTRALLALLLSAPGSAEGRPWRPDDLIPITPLPGYPPGLWACYRAGREGMLGALVRRGLLGRLPDGQYYLTPQAPEALP
jgi:hypothetical protein